MKIGYARVSTQYQQDSLNAQQQVLKSYGCGKIYTDQLSGAKSSRPGLAAALEYAREKRLNCSYSSR
ncbi:recombinase family protein [Rothia sp. ZJ932]|nr:recombinase family protein [Rothia sp. ZJ932]